MPDQGQNEVGTAPPRWLPEVSRDDVERQLGNVTGQPFRLPENAVISGHPTTCPACGAAAVEWGCSEYVTQTREEIHPLVWDDTAWMADSFVCRTCDAGWFEDDDAQPITWVRPYWRLDPGAGTDDERQPVPGWNVHIEEVSGGVYRLRAVDGSGRTVEATGFDEDELVEKVRQADRERSVGSDP